MELVNNPKSNYPFDATLESLHAESMTWMKDLELWSDEMMFFYKLLRNTTVSRAFPPAEVAEVGKELIRINAEVLDRLKIDVASHERSLASVFKSASLPNEQLYRDRHRVLSDDMSAVHEDLRKFKRKIFSFMENRADRGKSHR
jgi:hypothetical protein